MIILLYGPDSYRREEKKRFIIGEFIKKHGPGGVSRFDLESGGLDSVLEFLRSGSLFDSHRLAVISGEPEKASKQYTESLKEALENPSVTALISLDAKPTSPSFLVPKAEKKTKATPKPASKKSTKPKAEVLFQAFEVLKGKDWESFIETEAKTRDLELDLSAKNLLADFYKGDSWGLTTELETLSLRHSKKVSLKDVEHMSVFLPADFWATINSLRSPSLGVRLGVIEKMFATGEPSQKMFHILSYQWKEKLHVFAKYDELIKSGKLDYDEALLSLVL